MIFHSPCALLLLAFLPGALFPMEPDSKLQGVITLTQAMKVAMAHSPEISAARYEVKAREADFLQSRLPDNPELGLEIENLASKGALAEENRQVTASLSQTLDLGRHMRASVAKREMEMAGLDLEVAIRRIRSRVRKYFVSVQAAQDKVGLAREILVLAQSAHKMAAEKVLAGKAPPTDSLQSMMALAQASIDSGRVAEGLGLARRSLSALCGQLEVAFDSVQGRVDLLHAVPSWEAISSHLPESPEWKVMGMGPKIRAAEVRSEQFARVPAITLEAGVRQVPDKNGRALVAGIAMPIPAWNRNQGAIRAAQSRRGKAEAEAKAERSDWVNRLAALLGQATRSHLEAVTLGERILPAALATFAGAQEAYRAGKFGSLEVLNAQRSLFEAKSRYLDALESHRTAMAELEELTGLGKDAAKPDCFLCRPELNKPAKPAAPQGGAVPATPGKG